MFICITVQSFRYIEPPPWASRLFIASVSYSRPSWSWKRDVPQHLFHCSFARRAQGSVTCVRLAALERWNSTQVDFKVSYVYHSLVGLTRTYTHRGLRVWLRSPSIQSLLESGNLNLTSYAAATVYVLLRCVRKSQRQQIWHVKTMSIAANPLVEPSAVGRR